MISHNCCGLSLHVLLPVSMLPVAHPVCNWPGVVVLILILLYTAAQWTLEVLLPFFRTHGLGLDKHYYILFKILAEMFNFSNWHDNYVLNVQSFKITQLQSQEITKLQICRAVNLQRYKVAVFKSTHLRKGESCKSM